MSQQKGKRLKRKKYSSNQIVVFRFGERNLVGKVVNAKPVGKKSFVYDVKGENGITYEEMGVDAGMNHTIDTNLTKIFYKANGITQSHLPTAEHEEVELDVESVLHEEQALVESDSFRSHEDEVDFSYKEMFGEEE